jgi:hypothetical protein
MSYKNDHEGYSAGYRDLQFQTDVPASDVGCNIVSGAGCQAPPAGAAFYPFYSLLSGGWDGWDQSCQLTFGNDIKGKTINDFGKDAQYGPPSARYFGDLAGGVMHNPCKP